MTTKDPVDNLKLHQFKPGQSGNPSGRPKGTSITARLRKALEKNDGALAEMIVKVAIREAGRGKFQHFQEILNRVDGTLVTRICIDAELEKMLDVAERVLEPDQYALLVAALATASSGSAA